MPYELLKSSKNNIKFNFESSLCLDLWRSFKLNPLQNSLRYSSRFTPWGSNIIHRRHRQSGAFSQKGAKILMIVVWNQYPETPPRPRRAHQQATVFAMGHYICFTGGLGKCFLKISPSGCCCYCIIIKLVYFNYCVIWNVCASRSQWGESRDRVQTLRSPSLLCNADMRRRNRERERERKASASTSVNYIS